MQKLFRFLRNYNKIYEIKIAQQFHIKAKKKKISVANKANFH